MWVTQRVRAVQYDGTNGADVAAAMSSGYPYEEDGDNLIVRDGYGRPVTVTPTDWVCNGVVYPDRAALEEYWFVLAEEPAA